VKFVPKPLRKTSDISRGKASFKGWLRSAASALLTLLLMYFGVGLLTDLVIANISEKTEARWFSWTFAAMAKASDDKDEELERAQAIFSRLIENSEVRPLPYQLFLIDMPDPNALALPGGGVGVTRGLLKKVENETGMAMVLAHELGHHTGRHNLKRIGRMLAWNTLLNVVMGGVDLSALELGVRLSESGYGREQERNADEFGMRLVHQVYGHTQGALEFFELVQTESRQDDSKWLAFTSTHPLTTERISYLKDLQQHLKTE